MRIFNPIIFVTVSLLFITVGCVNNSNHDAPNYEEFLVVLDGASEVDFARADGTQQVAYSLTVIYPAPSAIAELDDELKARGWKVIEMDWLNPQMPTSHSRGWAQYIDETSEPKEEVFAWYANWGNDNGDILVYSLTYSRPIDKQSEMNHLKVVGILIPNNIVKKRLHN